MKTKIINPNPSPSLQTPIQTDSLMTKMVALMKKKILSKLLF